MQRLPVGQARRVGASRGLGELLLDRQGRKPRLDPADRVDVCRRRRPAPRWDAGSAGTVVALRSRIGLGRGCRAGVGRCRDRTRAAFIMRASDRGFWLI